MINRSLCLWVLVTVLLWHCCLSESTGDAAVMQLLKKGLTQMGSLDWSHPNPCHWDHVQCNSDDRVTRIQIGNLNLHGTLPSELNTLTALQRFEVMRNQLTGPLPTLSGLTSLQVLLLHTNQFSSVPSDFFAGMSSLQAVDLGDNPFSPWQIPDSLAHAASLQNFSANSANIVGPIPGFITGDSFPGLTELHLSFNALEGGLPAAFAGSSIQSLWLNNFKPDSKLNGSIGVLRDMVMLTEVWLQGNHFTGPLPDLAPVTGLWSLNLRDNNFTGVVPASLVNMHSLRIVNLTNNHLQGSPPKFNTNVVEVDMIDNRNSFCVNEPSAHCDPVIDVLLSIVETMNYPNFLAENWKGNDPCNDWVGITCFEGNIVVFNFHGKGITGTISPRFSELKSLKTLILSDNLLNGVIPVELATLPHLTRLDVSNNNLDGNVPTFRHNVVLMLEGNRLNEKLPIGNPPDGNFKPVYVGEEKKSSKIGVVVGSVGCVVFIGLIGVAGLCFYKRRKTRSCDVFCPDAVVKHPIHSEDLNAVKITIAASRVNGVESKTYNHPTDGLINAHVVEGVNNMAISMELVQNMTGNFCDDNVLGKGEFGVVYKGETKEGTKIVVKRMQTGTIDETEISQFKCEIDALSQVRHRHLVALMGYCLDENEKVVVYEYMAQGNLERHLFEWKEHDLKPLAWMSRLVIALDVARGVEYLHGLAHQTFVHGNLKPSNILLDDDLRAKVADFGLVRLALPGKSTFYTELARTSEYIAPEYSERGGVDAKVDVYSFGIILMEMITGKRVAAAAEAVPSQESIENCIDPTIELDDESLSEIKSVLEVAGHCCGKEANRRPDMRQVVSVLFTLMESWNPGNPSVADNQHESLLHNRIHQWQWENEDTTIL